MPSKSLPQIKNRADAVIAQFPCVTNLRKQSLPNMVRIAKTQNISTLAIVGLLAVDLLLAIGTLGVSLILWKLATGNPFYGLFAYTVESRGFPARQQLAEGDQKETDSAKNASQTTTVQQAAATVGGRIGAAPGWPSLGEMSGGGFSSAGGLGKTPSPALAAPKPASVKKFREDGLNFEKGYDGWGSFFFSLTYLGYLETIKANDARYIINADECASIARSGNYTEDSERGEYQLKLVAQEKVVRDSLTARIMDLRNNQTNRVESPAEGSGTDLKLMAAGREISKAKIDAILHTIEDGPTMQAIEPIQEVPQEQICENGKEKIEDGDNAVSVISEDIVSDASDRSESENPEMARQYHLEHGENPDINDEDFFLLMSQINNKKIIILNDAANEIIIYDGRQSSGDQPTTPPAERIEKLRVDPQTMTSRDYAKIKSQYFQAGTFYSFCYEERRYYAQIAKGSALKSSPSYPTTGALMAVLHLQAHDNPGGGDCGFYALWDNWDWLIRDKKVELTEGKGAIRNQSEVRNAIYRMMKKRLAEINAPAEGQAYSPPLNEVELDILASMEMELENKHKDAYDAYKEKKRRQACVTDGHSPNGPTLGDSKSMEVWEAYMNIVTGQDAVFGTECDMRLFARLLGRPLLILTTRQRSGAIIIAFDFEGRLISGQFTNPVGELKIDSIQNFIEKESPIMLENINDVHWKALDLTPTKAFTPQLSDHAA